MKKKSEEARQGGMERSERDGHKNVEPGTATRHAATRVG